MKKIKDKKGQVAIEYILTALALFGIFLIFHQSYSWIVPKQFEKGAKVILTVNERK